MNVEALMQLIGSDSSENAEIVWQIAWGQKQSGDPEFQEFIKAVAAWTFGDLPARRPVEFIQALCKQELHCNILRKLQLPISSKALAPFVRRIFVKDIQTEAFPKGFEYFEEANYLSFGTQRFKGLGAELKEMPSLRTLRINNRLYFELLPGIVETSVTDLRVSSWDKIRFPENLAEMQHLEELYIGCGARFEGPVWDCKQLKRLTLSDMTYSFSWDTLGAAWEGVAQLQNLENLTLLLPNHTDYNIELPKYFFELENLKALHVIISEYSNPVHFGKEIRKLKKLETLTVGHLSYEERKWIFSLPNLKKLITCDKNQYQELCNWAMANKPDVQVELYKT